MAGVAHRDRLLEDDADAAARRVFERLFVLVAEVIAVETVKRGTERERERVDKVREQVSQGALTERQTLGSWFERRAAYSSNCSFELPLRPSARAAAPL